VRKRLTTGVLVPFFNIFFTSSSAKCTRRGGAFPGRPASLKRSQSRAEINLVAVRLARAAQGLCKVVSVGQMDSRLNCGLIRQFFPASPICRACSSFDSLCRTPHNKRADWQCKSRHADNPSTIVAATNIEADRLAPFFGHGKAWGKELLLDAAEELIASNSFSPEARAQEPDVEHHKSRRPG